jgi:hypothetical protein
MQVTAIKKAHRINKENLEEGVTLPKEYNLMKKSKDNPNSLRAVIKAMCFNCMGGTIDEMPDPGWQHSIRTCTAPNCPSFPQRPYRRKEVKTKSPAEVGDVSKSAKPKQLNLLIAAY